MSNIDHLHAGTEMLQVEDHSELLYAQYLAMCATTSQPEDQSENDEAHTLRQTQSHRRPADV